MVYNGRMRRQLARVITIFPWALLAAGHFGKEFEDRGLHLVLSMLGWIAGVSLLLLVATLVEASGLRGQPERDDRR